MASRTSWREIVIFVLKGKKMIFGDDEIMNPSGNLNFWSDGTVQNKSGNVIYENGVATNTSNNLMWTKKGTVNHSGNQYWAPDGIYNLSSNGVLHGPNGKVWNGVKTDTDAKSIISHELNK